MTTNPTEYHPPIYEDAPLTPRNDGKVQFLGPETVRYISPPRVEVFRQRVRQMAPPPTQQYSTMSPPPSYHSSVYPGSQVQAIPPPQPQIVPVSMSMVSPQYMMPQMAPMIAPQPQMMCMPTMQHPIIAAAPMAQMMAPVQLTPPQIVQAPQQQTSPAVTLCINQSPQLGGIPGGNGNALVCPKCRKGIITRQQNRLRKKILLCLGLCCCPLTCGIPLFWLCCNYVDTCGACGKSYGHRGKKNYKKKVNAVTL